MKNLILSVTGLLALASILAFVINVLIVMTGPIMIQYHVITLSTLSTALAYLLVTLLSMVVCVFIFIKTADDMCVDERK